MQNLLPKSLILSSQAAGPADAQRPLGSIVAAVTPVPTFPTVA